MNVKKVLPEEVRALLETPESEAGGDKSGALKGLGVE